MLRAAQRVIARLLPIISLLVLPALAVLVLASPQQPAFAQGASLNDQEQLGQRLFGQSCVECHKSPQINGTSYAPALSKDTLGGKADVIHDVISNGTPRMPGFKIHFKPAQIDAIVSYIKTIPVPAAAAPRPAKGGAGEPD